MFKKKNQTWKLGTNDRMAHTILNIATEGFDATQALYEQDEIRHATDAIIKALPIKLQHKIDDMTFRHIASIVLLQRAAAQYQVGLLTGAKAKQTAETVERLVKDTLVA